MEVNKADKSVIAKPVASRPTVSSFRSFSELLATATKASPSNACSETIVSAIRPKALRFKPMVDHAPDGVSSSQAVISAPAGIYLSNEVLKSDGKSDALFKPVAKFALRTTVSELTAKGSSNSNYQLELAETGGLVPERVIPTEVYMNSASQSEREKPTGCSKLASKNLAEDQKMPLHTNTEDHLSNDGYNWRKYGQKQVKGSEYPRSYYKCTHPNCSVKKKVERSLNGQIEEIVYTGEHNHLKPQPLKRSSSDRQRQVFISDSTDRETNNPPWSNQLIDRNEGYECRIGNENEVGSSSHSTHSSNAPGFCDSIIAGAFCTAVSAADDSCGFSKECDEVNKNLETKVDGPEGKRRRREQPNEAGGSGEALKEPSTIVQNSSDSEVLGDGYHWRKYGQKVVKGNSYPRSYYRCTSLKCNVRKYVERTSDDSGAYITKYEGRHNHDIPPRKTNMTASRTNTKMLSTGRIS